MSSQNRGKKYKNKNKMCILFIGPILLCLISNTMPQLEQFLAAINRPSASPPSTDQLQPSPSTPPPHLQKRKTQAATGYDPPPPLGRGVEKPEGPSALQPTTENRSIIFDKLFVTFFYE